MTDEESLRERAQRAGMPTRDALRVLSEWRDSWQPPLPLFSRREAIHRAIADMVDVEHLRAENAAYRAIVERVASLDTEWIGDGEWGAPAYTEATVAPFVTQARALLAQEKRPE